MDISVSATASASYLSPQAFSQPGGAGVSANTTGQSTSTQAGSAGPVGTNAGNSTASQTAASPDKQLQQARKQNPTAEVTAHPGYIFEVDQQNHKIMKVSDAKGVLIYQVPSKGQLALVEAQDSAQKSIQLTA
jgi:hypothetical protein